MLHSYNDNTALIFAPASINIFIVAFCKAINNAVEFFK